VRERESGGSVAFGHFLLTHISKAPVI